MAVSSGDDDSEDSLSPPTATPKRVSQFAGAAAMFQQKESNLQMKQERERAAAKTKRTSQFDEAIASLGFNDRANASMSQLDTMGLFQSPTPGGSKQKVGAGIRNYDKSNNISALVTPGSARASWMNNNKDQKTNGFPSPPLSFGSPVGNKKNRVSAVGNKMRIMQKQASISRLSPNSKLSLDSHSERGSRSIFNEPGKQSVLDKNSTGSYLDIAENQKDAQPKRFSSLGRGAVSPYAADRGTPVNRTMSVGVGSVVSPSSGMWKAGSAARASMSPKLESFHRKRGGISPTNSTSLLSSKHTYSKFDKKIDDIKIQTNIPDIDAKIRARRLGNRKSSQVASIGDDENVPEHIRKFREKERARQAAMDEKERAAEIIIHAIVLGWWFRRKQWPKLKQDYTERKRIRVQKEAAERLRFNSAIKIQASFRGFGPRTQFKRRLEKIRLRQRQQRRINELERRIAQIERNAKDEIDAMRKKCDLEKAKLDRDVEKSVKQEDDKLEEIRSTGRNLIEYLKGQNQKVRDEMSRIKKDVAIAKKQQGVLQQRKDQVDSQIGALNEFIEKITKKNQAKEIMEKKIRTRYLPRHREDLQDRDNHCVLESRVKNMYKETIEKTLVRLGERNKDHELNDSCVKCMKELASEIKRIPKISTPETLVTRISGD